MRRSLLTVALLVFASLRAPAQHLYFSTLIPANCPIVIEGIMHSKDFGFQLASFLNDSSQTVESMYLKVTLSAPGQPEQIVDSGHIYISIEPGDRKSQDLFLGRVQALHRRAEVDHLEIARALISVESVEFADGSRWYAEAPVEFEPIDPIRPPRPQ
jgi:hypothetical protein